MNPNDMTTLISALEPLLSLLAQLGLPGMLLVVLSTPALLVVVLLVMSHFASMRMEKAYAHFQENMNETLEAYRSDTQQILRELGEKHAEVSRYYTKNVDLVKNYERMTDALQTLVVNNTRAMEHLSTIIESRGEK